MYLKLKFKCQVFPSPQDRKTNLSICFLGEVTARQFCSEIYWPLCIFLLKIWQTLAKTSEFKFWSGTLNGMNFGCHDIYTCSPFKLKRSNKWQRVPRKGDNSSQILLRTFYSFISIKNNYYTFVKKVAQLLNCWPDLKKDSETRFYECYHKSECLDKKSNKNWRFILIKVWIL